MRLIFNPEEIEDIKRKKEEGYSVMGLARDYHLSMRLRSLDPTLKEAGIREAAQTFGTTTQEVEEYLGVR